MQTRKSKLIAGILTATVLMAASSARSDMTHNQSMVDIDGFGWDSVGGVENVQQIADDFRPPADGSIKFLHWTVKYHNGSELAPKKFEVRLFVDANGRPGAVIFTQSLMVAGADTGGADSGSHKLLTYTAVLRRAPILRSDRTYWLSIREDDPSTSALWSWSFHNSDVSGGYSYRRGENAPWTVGVTDMAYSLSIDPLK